MPAQPPADVNRLLAQAVTQGITAIAAAMDGVLALHPTIDLQILPVTQVGDTLLLRSTWTLTGAGPDHLPVQLAGTSTNVVRRQADGTWQAVLSQPWGAPPAGGPVRGADAIWAATGAVHDSAA